MNTAEARDRLLGVDRERSVGYLLAAGAVLVAGLGLLSWLGRTGQRGVALGVPGVDYVWFVAAVAVGPAAIPGYLDDGLLAGWALGTAPFLVRVLGPAVVPAAALDEPVLVGVATAVLVGIVAGSLGFGVGAGVRRVRAGR